MTSTAVATPTEAKAKAPALPALKVGGGVAAIVPQDAEQAWRMAQLIVNGGMAPPGMDRPEKVVTAILHGLEVGLKPMQAVQSIAVVNNRPTIWGDAALGLVQGSGLLEDFEERIDGDGDNRVAYCRAKRVDRETPIERTFSVADAKKAGLWDKSGPWKQYPQRMLQMRARSWCIRDGFPDVLKGLQVREEVRDFVAPAASAEEAPAITAATIKATATAAQTAPEPARTVTDAEFTETPPGVVGAEPAATPATPQAEQAPADDGADEDASAAWLSVRKAEIDAAASVRELDIIMENANAMFEDDPPPAATRDAFVTYWRARMQAVVPGSRPKKERA